MLLKEDLFIMLRNGPLTGKGYYLIEKGFSQLPIFKKEPYTEREAWLYLIEKAAYQPYLKEAEGMAIPLGIGELIASARFLAEEWHWSTKNGWAKDRANRLIQKFVRHGWITVDTNYYAEQDSSKTTSCKRYNKRPSLITICKYRELQHKLGKEIDSKTYSDTSNFETDRLQECDKPNQEQSILNNKTKNKLVGDAKQDTYLFETFPKVKNPEDFINYMPTHWQNYALHEKGWDIDKIISEAKWFWKNYSGLDMENRNKRHSTLAKRKHWDKVWVKWCDQEFRNVYD
jgi:hypothetical protein